MYWHGAYYVFGRYLIGTSVPDRYMVGTVRYCNGIDPSRIIDQWTVTSLVSDRSDFIARNNSAYA